MTLRTAIAAGLIASTLSVTADARAGERGPFDTKNRPSASTPAITPPAVYWTDGFSRHRPQRPVNPPVKPVVEPAPPGSTLDTKFKGLFNSWAAPERSTLAIPGSP